ncbi:MAG: response regulator [Oscillospiraceae bacterium]|nr:response regulator [Oscillospiraceae bacterium]
MENRKNRTTLIAAIGGMALVFILVFGTIWVGRSATKDTESAVRSVSLLYLDELAGRREQVVAENMKEKIKVIETALELMTEDDLRDMDHLQAYQAKMKRLFVLEKFAFVDRDGLIYTSLGTQTDIGQYPFDHLSLSGPEISVKNPESVDKKVIIAVPVHMSFQGKELLVCFMEIDMDEMLSGVSMDAQEGGATVCNMYTSDGIALSNTVLGGLAVEDNLLEALTHAQYEPGYSYENVVRDFAEGNRGVVSFAYNGIRETLTYVPVTGTNWLLTYLIRESVISENISAISNGIIRRSMVQTVLTVLVLLGMFGFMFRQARRNAALTLEKETADAENRVKQTEMERRLALQNELLEQKQQQEEQNRMITALASDYWSVYYLDLDKDDGVCYQAHEDLENGFKVGEHFPYLATMATYAQANIKEEYKEEFLRFIRPENIKFKLSERRVISYRYMVHRHGRDSWEEVRFAGVRHPEDRKDHLVHAVGACFVDVDEATRKSVEQNKALQEALREAEAANKAKTIFLSNMSHEIRTPMNAIIGLDNIALNDPTISAQTREHLEKIGASAHHLLNIINDILDMSRIESGRLTIKNEEFSFSKALEQVNTIISGQCRDKGLNYECRTKGRIDEYYIGDDLKLRQVMINILGNAVKFTPPGGSVFFDIEDVARLDNKVTLRFTITDTGIGMSKEYLPKLFEPFSQEDSSTTNKYGSTGLGMPITKSIVELMNGSIEVESEKGKGTTFVVTITLTQADHHLAGGGDIELRPHEMSVLVVDDDRIACEHAQVILGQVGVSCEVVTSGIEAVEMVKMRHARREDYNLILVDWKMPEMDGVETTRQIRSIVGSDTPIIILTSYNWDDIEEEAREAGVDTFAAKPLFAGTVMDEFREAFKKKNANLARKTADLTGRRILLAEDMAVNAEIMTMVLAMREMEAEHAENGRIAVEMFSRSKPGYYDAILMDMRMPEMDGLEATRTIRELDRPDAKTIPIIALTANAFDEDVQRSMQAGLDAHLSKPVEPETLFETLENLIR